MPRSFGKCAVLCVASQVDNRYLVFPSIKKKGVEFQKTSKCKTVLLYKEAASTAEKAHWAR